MAEINLTINVRFATVASQETIFLITEEKNDIKNTFCNRKIALLLCRDCEFVLFRHYSISLALEISFFSLFK